MIRQPLPPPGTSVQDVLAAICAKWAVLILSELTHGPRRHGELHRAIRGVSEKMLAQTLRALQRDRLVRRTVHPTLPRRVEYALTPLGETLAEPLRALHRWTEEHAGEIQRARRDWQKGRPAP
jgi:DNA-binding HxlR family transcriptional regulator